MPFNLACIRTVRERGDIVLEWWQTSKKITCYIRPTEANYVLVWGENMDTEMDEGIVTSRDEFARLWTWLHA